MWFKTIKFTCLSCLLKNHYLFITRSTFNLVSAVDIFTEAENYLDTEFFSSNEFDYYFKNRVEYDFYHLSDRNRQKQKIKLFQQYFDLPKTGYPDSNFLEQKKYLKYCDFPDVILLKNFDVNTVNPNKKYNLNFTLSTDYFKSYDNLYDKITGLNVYQETVNQIYRNLYQFEQLLNLKFRFLTYDRRQNYDLLFKFAAVNHGDAFPMDKLGGSIGHSFPAEEIELDTDSSKNSKAADKAQKLSGQVHLDFQEGWEWRFKAGTAKSTTFQAGKEYKNPPDLDKTILHMLGHSFGLLHNNLEDSIMNPRLKSNFYSGLSGQMTKNYEIPKVDQIALLKLYENAKNTEPEGAKDKNSIDNYGNVVIDDLDNIFYQDLDDKTSVSDKLAPNYYTDLVTEKIQTVPAETSDVVDTNTQETLTETSSQSSKFPETSTAGSQSSTSTSKTTNFPTTEGYQPIFPPNPDNIPDMSLASFDSFTNLLTYYWEETSRFFTLNQVTFWILLSITLIIVFGVIFYFINKNYRILRPKDSGIGKREFIRGKLQKQNRAHQETHDNRENRQNSEEFYDDAFV